MKIGQKIISAEEHLGKYVKTRRENIVIPQKVKDVGNTAERTFRVAYANTLYLFYWQAPNYSEKLLPQFLNMST